MSLKLIKGFLFTCIVKDHIHLEEENDGFRLSPPTVNFFWVEEWLNILGSPLNLLMVKVVVDLFCYFSSGHLLQNKYILDCKGNLLSRIKEKGDFSLYIV